MANSSGADSVLYVTDVYRGFDPSCRATHPGHAVCVRSSPAFVVLVVPMLFPQAAPVLLFSAQEAFWMGAWGVLERIFKAAKEPPAIGTACMWSKWTSVSWSMSKVVLCC